MKVYNVIGRTESPSESKYSTRLTVHFNETLFWSLLYDLVPSVTAYLESLPSIPDARIPDGAFEDLIRFTVTALESLNYLIELRSCNRPNMGCVDATTACADAVLKQSFLRGVLALETHTSWLCSAINCVYKLVRCFLLGDEPLPAVPAYGLAGTLENVETVSAGHACHQMAVLLSWLEKGSGSCIPEFLLERLRSIIVSLARLPLCNSYLLTPRCAWRNGFGPTLSGTYNTQVPPLPIEFLQDVDVLEEFIFR